MKSLLPALLLLGALAAPARATIHTVNIVDNPDGSFSYVPNSVFLTLGDTVKWVNQSFAVHTVTSGISPTPDGRFDSGLLAHLATFQRAFTAMGPYRYFCTVHPTLMAMVRVTRALVVIKDFSFNPSAITVTQGDTVVWRNDGAFTHTSTSGTAPVADGLWDTGFLGSGASASVPMGSTGLFPYFCSIHTTTMHGSVTVGSPVAVGDGPAGVTRLLAARPNPARGVVRLDFELSAGARARLTILDAAGRLVRVLADGLQPAGRHTLTWDGRAASGVRAASGTYSSRLDAPGTHATRRFTWLR